MKFPLAGVLYLLGTAVTFAFYYRLHRSYKETKNRFTFYFKNFGLYGWICTLIYGLMCIFFTNNSFVLGIGNIVGEGLLMIGFVYGLAFFFYLTFPEIPQKKIFLTGGFLVFLSTISRIAFFPYPTITESGILKFNTPPVQAITYSIWAFAGLVPLTFAFFREAIRKPGVRIKCSLLGIFLLMVVATSTIHALVDNALVYTLAFLGQMASFSLLFIIVLSRPKDHEAERTFYSKSKGD